MKGGEETVAHTEAEQRCKAPLRGSTTVREQRGAWQQRNCQSDPSRNLNECKQSFKIRKMSAELRKKKRESSTGQCGTDMKRYEDKTFKKEYRNGDVTRDCEN